MRPVIEPGTVVSHFKRDLISNPGALYTYLFIGTAKHTETGEELAVYRALYGTKELYVRPMKMFLSLVDKKKYPKAVQNYRFEPLYRRTKTTLREIIGQGIQEACLRSEHQCNIDTLVNILTCECHVDVCDFIGCRAKNWFRRRRCPMSDSYCSGIRPSTETWTYILVREGYSDKWVRNTLKQIAECRRHGHGLLTL